MRSKFYLKISWSFIFTLFTVLSIFGQKNIIRGIVYDEFGEVLIGATILEKGNPENYKIVFHRNQIALRKGISTAKSVITQILIIPFASNF